MRCPGPMVAKPKLRSQKPRKDIPKRPAILPAETTPPRTAIPPRTQPTQARRRSRMRTPAPDKIRLHATTAGDSQGGRVSWRAASQTIGRARPMGAITSWPPGSSGPLGCLDPRTRHEGPWPLGVTGRPAPSPCNRHGAELRATESPGAKLKKQMPSQDRSSDRRSLRGHGEAQGSRIRGANLGC